MTERYNLDQIREYWSEQARKYPNSASASWTDHSVIELEITEVLKHLIDGDRVLDVGCANGFSTFHWAMAKQLDIKGVDYIPEMIAQAQARLEGRSTVGSSHIQFGIGDITKLSEPSDHFDKVIVVRVLINLGSWDRQLVGLRECCRVLKPGGLLLLSEATQQGWAKLNDFRGEWQLDAIPMPPFNTYIDCMKLQEAAQPGMKLIQISDFASTYYVATRVLKPLLTKALGAAIDISNPLMHWNRFFASFQQVGDYGTQKLLVFRKTP